MGGAAKGDGPGREAAGPDHRRSTYCGPSHRLGETAPDRSREGLGGGERGSDPFRPCARSIEATGGPSQAGSGPSRPAGPPEARPCAPRLARPVWNHVRCSGPVRARPDPCAARPAGRPTRLWAVTQGDQPRCIKTHKVVKQSDRPRHQKNTRWSNKAIDRDIKTSRARAPALPGVLPRAPDGRRPHGPARCARAHRPPLGCVTRSFEEARELAHILSRIGD